MDNERICPEPRRALKRAIGWRTLADIVCAHPSVDLRILETHPGGGQYDCLSLRHGKQMALVANINIAGTSLLLGEPLGRPRPVPQPFADIYGGEAMWRYPQHALGEDRSELPLAIEAFLGLPERAPKRPALTASTLSLVVLGALLERVAFGERVVDLRNGWFDSSGSYAVPGPRPWVRPLPGGTPSPDSPWQVASRAVGRYWALSRTPHTDDPTVIVDVATSRLWVRGATQASLQARFNQGAGIRALAWALESALDGKP